MKIKVLIAYSSKNIEKPGDEITRKVNEWLDANPECKVKDIEIVPFVSSTQTVCHYFITATIKYEGNETNIGLSEDKKFDND
jgi:hypothetical protein